MFYQLDNNGSVTIWLLIFIIYALLCYLSSLNRRPNDDLWAEVGILAHYLYGAAITRPQNKSAGQLAQ